MITFIQREWALFNTIPKTQDQKQQIDQRIELLSQAIPALSGLSLITAGSLSDHLVVENSSQVGGLLLINHSLSNSASFIGMVALAFFLRLTYPHLKNLSPVNRTITAVATFSIALLAVYLKHTYQIRLNPPPPPPTTTTVDDDSYLSTPLGKQIMEQAEEYKHLIISIDETNSSLFIKNTNDEQALKRLGQIAQTYQLKLIEEL